MNLAPRARGEEVARVFCAFHGHKIVDVHEGGLFKDDKLICIQCGATLREIREPSPEATHANEELRAND